MTDHSTADLRAALRGIAAEAPPFDPESVLADLRDGRSGSRAGDELAARRRRPRGRVLPWATGAAAAGLLVTVGLTGTVADRAAQPSPGPTGGAVALAPLSTPEESQGPTATGEGGSTFIEVRPSTGLVDPGPTITLPTTNSATALPRPTSGLRGTITTTPTGCVVVRAEDGRLVPARWPAGSRAMSRAGDVVVVTADGHMIDGNGSGRVLLRGTPAPAPAGRCGQAIATVGFDIATVDTTDPVTP